MPRSVLSLVSVVAFGLIAADAPPTPFAPLPKHVSSFGAIRLGDEIYVYGGHSGKTHSYSTETTLGTFQRIPVAGGTKWEELPGGPGLQGLNLAAANGKIYRVGGMEPRNKPTEKTDARSIADVAVFDPQVRKWAAFPAMPEGRSSHDVVAVGTKLIVAGGWEMKTGGQESGWHKTALICDTAAKEPKWEAIPQPFQRRALTAAALGSKVYVLGGLTASGSSVRTVDVLDTETRKWSSAPDFPGDDRSGFSPAACVVGNRLVLSTMDKGIYALNTAGTAWEKVGEAAEARFVNRIVPKSATEIVAIGGASMKGPLATLEVVKLDIKPDSKAGAGASKVQKYCPVMTTDEVSKDSHAVTYKGVTVLLCCDACVGKFRRDPAAYLDPKFIPALEGMALPPRGTDQEYCPVLRVRKISVKDPFVMYKGVKVYFYNDTAKLRFEKDPERYADVSVLPQLKK